MSVLITYREIITHTVRVDIHGHPSLDDLQELVTDDTVDSVDYRAEDFRVLNVSAEQTCTAADHPVVWGGYCIDCGQGVRPSDAADSIVIPGRAS